MPVTATSPLLPFQPLYKLHWLASLTVLACGCLGAFMAGHYPILPWLITAFFAALIGIFYAWPGVWMLLIPALLPVIGFAPWTGWLTFEELDLLILAAASAGYARIAINKSHQLQANAPSKKDVASLSLTVLFMASLMLAMFRGFEDAGGFSWGWFQGYHEAMNSIRLAKGFLGASLLLPLWHLASQQNAERASTLLSQGLMLGLAAVSLTTLWEREAFIGLTDFSTDYRTTGLFWEMHVGGAALDGFLALTTPFALAGLLNAKTPLRWGLTAIVLALASYACLTTFSRGVYLAIPIGMGVFLALHTRQHLQQTNASSRHSASSHRVAALLITALFAAAALWLFRSSGYRGMAALWFTMALMLPLVHALRGNSSGRLTKLPKPVTFAVFLLALAGTAYVAYRRGAATGLWHATPVLVALFGLFVVAAKSRPPLWPASQRWQLTTTGIMALVAATVGVMHGGSYMNERFSTGAQDLATRVSHWQLGRDMLRTRSDVLLGKGLGRFPANYYLLGNPTQHTGDYRLQQEGDNNYLRLTGGLHTNGWGEIFRITQRVAEPGSSATFSAKVRAEKDVTLHTEVCEKHLLYSRGCLISQINLKGTPGVWQTVKSELAGGGATYGDRYAPRLLAFSIAIETPGGVADIEALSLSGPDTGPLLTNGDFSSNLAHWFFSSDRHHLPWHIKSVFMNVFFEQGLTGLALWSLLLGMALWRTAWGCARQHVLAPALAGSLTGFMVVGLFDSLLDVPRLACLFYLLLLIALTLRQPTLSKYP